MVTCIKVNTYFIDLDYFNAVQFKSFVWNKKQPNWVDRIKKKENIQTHI